MTTVKNDYRNNDYAKIDYCQLWLPLIVIAYLLQYKIQKTSCIVLKTNHSL
jgi:hypothetical protein